MGHLRRNSTSVITTSLAMAGLFASSCLSSSVENSSSTSQSIVTSSDNTSTSDTSSSNTGIVQGGIRAARVIFRQSNPEGSFDASPTTGTAPGAGHAAVRLFNSDGTALASGTTDGNWPKWLTSVEIGVSGSSNTAATTSACARFTESTESNTTCTILGNSNIICSAGAGLFRVSEKDCIGTTTTGIGTDSDGVYIRTKFNRDISVLGASENILVVLEYLASSLSAGPTNPASCFTSNGLDTTNAGCSDMTWRAYLRPLTGTSIQNFLLLVPPSWAATTTTFGTQPITKQFILPLSSDANLSVLQLSRIQARIPTTNPASICSSNSPLCVGMIFYSMTFFRM